MAARGDNLTVNDMKVKSKEHQALNYLAVFLSTLQMLKDHKYGGIYQLMVSTEASDSDICKDDCGLLRGRHSMIAELLQIVSPHNLRERSMYDGPPQDSLIP